MRRYFFRFISTILTLQFIILCIFAFPEQAQAASYYVVQSYASITTLSKKNGKITIEGENNLQKIAYKKDKKINNDWVDMGKTKKTYKIAKKCKYTACSIDDKFSDKRRKLTYDNILGIIEDCKNGDGECSILCFVKNGKVLEISVLFS